MHQGVRPLDELPPGDNPPYRLNMVVEIPRGTRNKYEYDHEFKVFRLDRVLYSPMHYPVGYGLIPSTLAEDDDPLDIMVIIDEPTFPGCLLQVKPIGILEMQDQEELDQKVLSVPVNDPTHGRKNSLNDVESHKVREIEYFFSIYKELEEKQTKTKGWASLEKTHQIIEDAIRRYEDANPEAEKTEIAASPDSEE